MEEFEELENPELRKLAERLPSTIAHNRADSTVKNIKEPSGGGKSGLGSIVYQPCQLRSTIQCYICDILETHLTRSQLWRRQSMPWLGFIHQQD